MCVSFPTAAITSYHKLRSLAQIHYLTVFWVSKAHTGLVHTGLTWLYSQCLQAVLFLLEVLGEEFPGLFVLSVDFSSFRL